MAETGKKRGRPRTSTVWPAGNKLRSALYLSPEADQKLNLHATMMRLDRSELLEKLIHDHLTRYTVVDHEADRPGQGAAKGHS